MLVVTATLTVKPGHKDALFALAKPLMAATRKEDGCFGYTLLDDRSDETRCMFYEEWRDKAALQQHLKTDHIALWRRQSKDLLAAPTAIKLYEAQETSL
jgi:quinol monooxygenase YgiN